MKNTQVNVYHKSGRWVGFFITPEAAQEWIKTREASNDFRISDKPKDPSAEQTHERFDSREEALAAAKAGVK